MHRSETFIRAIFVWPWNVNSRTKQKQQTNGIERCDWFIERMQTRVAFGWLSEHSGEKLHSRELSRNQPILHFDVILQHDWPIEQCLIHIRVFFGGKTKKPCFDLFIHWLINQITNTYRIHFSRSYENRSNHMLSVAFYKTEITGLFVLATDARRLRSWILKVLCFALVPPSLTSYMFVETQNVLSKWESTVFCLRSA